MYNHEALTVLPAAVAPPKTVRASHKVGGGMDDTPGEPGCS